VENRWPPGLRRVHDREQGLKEAIQVDPRACPAAQFQDIVAGVPPRMNDPCWKNRRLACSPQNRLLAASGAERPGDDGGLFAVLPVDVERRTARVRRQPAINPHSGCAVTVTNAAQLQPFARMTIFESKTIS